VPIQLGNRPAPPQASRPRGVSLVVVALLAALVGIVGQELRWRSSAAGPQGPLARGEQAFRAGDDKAALALFSGLAEKGDPVAQYWLGHMTELGLGLPRDPAKAVELYKKAAAQDLRAAELRLGEIYLYGNLIPPDFAQAKTDLEKAAYQGDARAAMLLGQMYRAGIGMSANPTESYAWSEVSTLEGSAFAKRERDASFRDLSAADQKIAVTRAQEILKTVKSETAPPKPPSSP
jgi:TPR repeat protein